MRDWILDLAHTVVSMSCRGNSRRGNSHRGNSHRGKSHRGERTNFLEYYDRKQIRKYDSVVIICPYFILSYYNSMRISGDCVDCLAVVDPVPFIHGDDCWYLEYVFGPVVVATVADYAGLHVGEAARMLGQLSSYMYITGEVMRSADRLSRFHAKAVKGPLLPRLLVEHRWSEEYDRTIQAARPVRFSQAVDLDLIFTPGYMAEVDRSL